MKRLIVWLGVWVVCGTAWANSDPKIIMYEAGGQVYFVTGDILERLKHDAQDTCLEHVLAEDRKDAVRKGEKYDDSKTTVIKFYELLLSQCRQEIAALSGELQATGGLMEWVLGNAASFMANRSRNGQIPLSIEKEYAGCVQTTEKMKKVLSNNRKEKGDTYKYLMDADINQCIQSISINEGLNVNTCPLSPTISNRNDIAGMENMNDEYRGKSFYFDVTPNVRSGQFAVFNGKMMVVCDNGRAVHIVRPAFSGYTECRDAQYMAYPNVGTLPDGVYLVKHGDVEQAKDTESWGGYRAPLIPSQGTNTFGRANFYLHGTSNADKRRSGGCISLGVQIEEFIESDWFQNGAQDLIIVVKYK